MKARSIIPGNSSTIVSRPEIPALQREGHMLQIGSQRKLSSWRTMIGVLNMTPYFKQGHNERLILQDHEI